MWSALLVWVGMAWAGYTVEAGPVEKEQAESLEALATKEGIEGKIIRRFRLGHGWEYVLMVESLPTADAAEGAAARLKRAGVARVVVYADGDKGAPVPATEALPASTLTAAEWAARAKEAHGGPGGGANRLAHANAVHFVFTRTIDIQGVKLTIQHDYWREGVNRRMSVDGPAPVKSSVSIATPQGGWIRSAGAVSNRDAGVVVRNVDDFAPEVVLAASIDVWHLLDKPEVASFKVLEGAESGVRIGRGDTSDDVGVSFVDIDPATGRVIRVRYVTDAGPVVYEMDAYREMLTGVWIPTQLRMTRANGAVEEVRVQRLEVAERAPAGTFDKPTK